MWSYLEVRIQIEEIISNIQYRRYVQLLCKPLLQINFSIPKVIKLSPTVLELGSVQNVEFSSLSLTIRVIYMHSNFLLGGRVLSLIVESRLGTLRFD